MTRLEFENNANSLDWWEIFNQEEGNSKSRGIVTADKANLLLVTKVRFNNHIDIFANEVFENTFTQHNVTPSKAKTYLDIHIVSNFIKDIELIILAV